jgi:CRISPR-associated protein Csx16
MSTWFVSRHPGATEWARRQKLVVDQFVPHLDPVLVQPGDTVVGSLPVNLAARVCEAGARYWHLTLKLPPTLRGQELTANQLDALGAELHEFRVESTSSNLSHTTP